MSSTRPFTTEQASAIAATVVRPVLLFQGEFADQTIYAWTGVGDLSWNGQTWKGTGEFLQAGDIEEGVELQASSVSVTLTGIQSALLSEVLQEAQSNADGRIYLGLLDDTGVLIGDPYQIYRGRLDVPSVADGGQTGTIKITYQSFLVDLFRKRSLRYTDAKQKTLFPDDKGLEYSTAIAQWNEQWGKPK